MEDVDFEVGVEESFARKIFEVGVKEFDVSNSDNFEVGGEYVNLSPKYESIGNVGGDSNVDGVPTKPCLTFIGFIID